MNLSGEGDFNMKSPKTKVWRKNKIAGNVIESVSISNTKHKTHGGKLHQCVVKSLETLTSQKLENNTWN